MVGARARMALLAQHVQVLATCAIYAVDQQAAGLGINVPGAASGPIQCLRGFVQTKTPTHVEGSLL
jgi:hypothetical protein